MTKPQLIELLARFMDGATTVAEETRLADFFRSATEADRPEEISAADWQAYGELFRMFDVEQTATETRKPRRMALRWTAVAAASAAVLLLGALTLWRHPSEDVAPLTQVQQPVIDTASDSVAVDRKVPADSIVVPAVKPRKRKRHRLQSMPPIPKTYLAEAPADKASEGTETSTFDISQEDLEAAMRQADRLLQAMQMQQEAAFGDAQSEFLQAMDALDTDDEEYIEQ